MTTVSFLLLFCLAIYKKKVMKLLHFSRFLSCSSCFMQVNCSFRLIVSNTQPLLFFFIILYSIVFFFLLPHLIFSLQNRALYFWTVSPFLFLVKQQMKTTGSTYLLVFVFMFYACKYMNYLFNNQRESPFQYPVL